MIFFPVLYFERPSKISIQAGTASWKQTGVMFPWLKPCYDSYMILSFFTMILVRIWPLHCNLGNQITIT